MNNLRLIALASIFGAFKGGESFQLQQSYPKQILTKRNVGFGIDPSEWSDVKPHEEVIIAQESKKTTSNEPPTALNALESAWTKYGLIAYVAHMCAFLPLSLVPTYVQTKLGMLGKRESEHQALHVGQKCAQTLLQWIPFMNLGESSI